MVESFDLIKHVYKGTVHQDIATSVIADINAFQFAMTVFAVSVDCTQGLEGPSMVYFYENMERVQKEGWWFNGMPPAAIESASALQLIIPKNEHLSCDFLCAALCYNWVEYLSKSTKDDNPWLVQVAKHCAHPLESQTKFLDHYSSSCNARSYWKHAWRQAKQNTLTFLRTDHHLLREASKNYTGKEAPRLPSFVLSSNTDWDDGAQPFRRKLNEKQKAKGRGN